jgi:flagellar hook-associated protein 3 FlgL
MRVTQRAIALTSLQGLGRNLDSLGKLQQQLTSGRTISAPSDSPTGTNLIMQTRSEKAAVAQQARNISDAKSWLDETDSTLQTMLDATRRVRELTVRGLNDGASSEPNRKAIATEVDSLREGLIALANTRSHGRPLFGGPTSGPEAYVSSGAAAGTWTGQAGQVLRRVSDDEQMAINVTGPEAFGAAPADLFTVLKGIVGDLTTGAGELAANGRLEALDAVMVGMQNALAGVGVRGARIERLEQINADRVLSLESQLAETESIDLPNTIMKLQMAQVGYEAALAATAKSISPTLMDYLRG